MRIPWHTRRPRYLARETFSRAEAAPLASPHGDWPGGAVGVATLIQTAAGSTQAVSGGVLNVANPANAWGGQGWLYPAMPRAAGRALVTRITYSALGVAGKSVIAGWYDATGGIALANCVRGINLNSNAVFAIYPTGAQVATIAQGVEYTVVQALTPNGMNVFLRGGAFTDWTLVWCQTIEVASPVLRPGFSNRSAIFSLNDLTVIDIPGLLGTTTGFAALDVDAPVASTLYDTGIADGIFNLSIVLPDPMVGGEYRWRIQDANNYHVIRWTAAGAFQALKVVAGVDTAYSTPINVAGVFVAGFPGAVRVIAVGTTLMFYTINITGLNMAKRGATITDASFATETEVMVVPGVGEPVYNLRAWPRTSPLYDALDLYV